MKKSNPHKKSKLATWSFILSLIPIITFALLMSTTLIPTNNSIIYQIINVIFIALHGFIFLAHFLFIASIVLGIMTLINKSKGRGFAIAGIVISTISIIASVMIFISTFGYLFD